MPTGMQEGLPAEVELPSLSKLFRGLQMFSPTARCDSLNDRFWCIIIVARRDPRSGTFRVVGLRAPYFIFLATPDAAGPTSVG